MSDMISEKLKYLAQTKDLIRSALEDRGVTVQEGTPFRMFPELIGLIGSEGVAVNVRAARGICGKAASTAPVREVSVTIRASAE